MSNLFGCTVGLMTTVEAAWRDRPGDVAVAVRMSVETFSNRLVELRELNSVAGPASEGAIEEIIGASGLDATQQDDLRNRFREMSRGLLDLLDADERSSEKPTKFSLSVDDKEVGEVLSRVMLDGLLNIRRREVSSHARTGALMLMMGALETLVAGIATELLRDTPDRVSDQTFTVAQLESLGSVGAVRQYAIERTVESLMRGGVAEWTKFFAKFDVDWRQVAANWWEFREIDARRNLVAHANLTVNEVYLGIARESNAPAAALPKLGEKLDVSTDYLLRTVETLGAFGALLGISTLLKRRPAMHVDHYRWGSRICNQFFDWGLPTACALISSKLLSISRGRLPRTLDLEIRHIDWLSRKQMNGLAAIREEVEAFDYSGIDLAHSHMRAVILEAHDVSKKQISTLIEEGTLTRSAVRLRPQYRELLAAEGYDWLDGTTAAGY